MDKQGSPGQGLPAQNPPAKSPPQAPLVTAVANGTPEKAALSAPQSAAPNAVSAVTPLIPGVRLPPGANGRRVLLANAKKNIIGDKGQESDGVAGKPSMA